MGIIFDIQYGAMYDGPGLRTVVFFKGCPLRCEWCHNPESQSAAPQIGHFAEKCARCGACVKACPKRALYTHGKSAPVRDARKCVVCGACAAACPTGAMEMIGVEITPTEIAEKAARDIPFYETSGGGVTISGGEPTMQADFLIETLAALKEKGIHTAVETCGFFDTGLAEPLAAGCDLFLFDLKHVDEATHKERTGVSNRIIRENFRALLSLAGAAALTPRVPVIPGFNSSAKDIAGIIDFLRESGHPGPVHLMPYNRLAKTKWMKIQRADEYRDFGEPAEGSLESVAAQFREAAFDTVVNK